jgi:hypothetical protein
MDTHARSVGEPERTANNDPDAREDDPDGQADQQGADSTPIGLNAFNLGTIPASVTPPRTWRRAAWFAVVSAAAALIGLVVIGTTLVGPVLPTSVFSAMPYFPDGMPHTTAGPPMAAPQHAGSTQRGPLTVARPGDGLVTDAGARRPAPDGSASVHPTAASSPDPAADPDGGPSVPPGKKVPVTTVSSGPPTVDGGALLRTTQLYFAEVTSNANAAADLAANTVRADAAALIHQRYDQVATIKVQSISLDANTGVTISLLSVVNKDGTTDTAQTVLRFTLGTDPKIQNPGG